LTDAEKKRNTFGKTLRIFYDPKIVSTCFSTLPGSNGFPDIPLCHTSVEPYVIPVGIKKKKKFKSQLMEGVQLPMAGFPSIYTIPLESVRLEHIRVNCFGMGSRKQTFIIKLPPPSETCIPKPENLLGRTVLVNWPHLHEAFVVGISTLSGQYRLLQSANKIEYKAHEPDQQTSWAQFSFTEVTKLLCGRGIPGSGGLDLGEHGISCCLHVLPLQGMVSDPYSGALRKQFGTTEAVVPLQLAVIDKVISDDRFQETEGVELTKRFPVESTALITSGPWLGCTAVVKRVDTKLEQVTVHVNTIDKEPPFGYVIAQQIKERFHPTFMICKQLGITPTTLGVISGGLTLLPMKEDIGLNLKFRKDLLLPGYARLVTRGNENSNVTEAGEDESRDSNVWRKGDIVKIIGSSTASEKTETQPSKNKKSSGKNNKSFSDGNDPSAVSTTWEYSDRAVQLIAAYKSAFPYIFTNLDKASYSKNYLAKEILGVTCTGEKAAKEIDAKMEEIKQWLDKQALGKTEQSKHIPITSKYLPIAAIRAIEAAGSIRAKEREKNARANAQKPFVLQVQPFELFRPNPLVNQDLTGNQISATKSKNKGAPVLGDRVINISARGVPFGARGTVVATHVTSKCVEVLFDEAFTGGEALYGTLSLDRGKLIPWNSLLCVSTPPGQAPLGPQTSSAGPTAQVPVQKASVPILSNGKLQVSSNRVAAPKKLLRPGDLATATSSTPKVAQKQQHDPEAIAKLINKWGSAQKAQTQELPATAEGPTKNPHIEHQHEKSKKKKATKQESVPSSGDLAPSVAAFFSCAVAEPEGSGEETLAPSVAALFNAAGTIPPQPPARSPVSPPPAPSAPPVQAAMMSLFPHNYDLMDGTVCPRPPPTHLPPQPLFPLYGHFPAYPPSHHLHGQYPPQSQYPPAPPAMPSLEDFPTLTVAAKAPKKKPAPAPSRVKEAVNDKQKKKLSKKNGCSNTEQPDDFPISTPLKKEAPSLLLPTQILRKNTKPSTSS
jgi:5'-3' exoribonuclease 1